MKYLPLVWAGLWRKPLRTIFTLLSIVVAFVLFGILAGIDAGFAHALEISRQDRLFASSRFGTPLPLAYAEQIAHVPGVTIIAPRTGMFGYFQDPKNGLGVIAADERFFAARPELVVSKDQIGAWKRNRTAAIVGVFLANKYGWKVGDKVPLQTNVVKRDGTQVWTFDVVAIMENTDFLPGLENRFLANYDYVDEERTAQKGTADFFILRIDDPARATQIGRTIDALFATSGSPTRTTSERSQRESGAEWIGDVNFFTKAVLGAVSFMLLFLTGNTMMQSVRERIPEFAVLKTLGFSDSRIMLLVFAESIFLCTLAAIGGLLIAKVLIPEVKNAIQGAAFVDMPWGAFLTGFGLALLVALISGFIPAWRARNLNIVDALAGR